MIMKGFGITVLCWLSVLVAVSPVRPLYAYAVPPEYLDKLLPMYPADKGDCYVLLKPLSPYIESGKAPVCVTAVRNLNRFCNEPPQYDRRKVHSGIDGLHEPNWVALDAAENLDLVKQTLLARLYPQYRAAEWQDRGPYVTELASSRTLRLFQADVSSSNARLRGAIKTAYRLLNAGYPEQPGFNQPYLMFVATSEAPSNATERLGHRLYSDLWIFRDDLYLVQYAPHLKRMHRAFVIHELIRPRVGPYAPIGAPERCAIQHINDRQGGV